MLLYFVLSYFEHQLILSGIQGEIFYFEILPVKGLIK